jgi:hypothetical protein
MSDKEILERAIQTAIDGGYRTWEFDDKYTKVDEFKYLLGTLYDDPSENGNVQSVEALIFNHDFAKALYGDLPKCWEATDDYLDNDDPEDNGFIWNWQHHLQQMVIAEDKIKYLGEHLPEARS